MHLDWRQRWYYKANGPLQVLAEAVKTGHCCRPRLESLGFHQRFDMKDFAVVLKDGIVRLVILDLCQANFHNRAWEILKGMPRHLTTLKVLNIWKCAGLSGRDVHSTNSEFLAEQCPGRVLSLLSCCLSWSRLRDLIGPQDPQR